MHNDWNWTALSPVPISPTTAGRASRGKIAQTQVLPPSSTSVPATASITARAAWTKDVMRLRCLLCDFLVIIPLVLDIANVPKCLLGVFYRSILVYKYKTRYSQICNFSSVESNQTLKFHLSFLNLFTYISLKGIPVEFQLESQFISLWIFVT